jgi:hypothetical protein
MLPSQLRLSAYGPQYQAITRALDLKVIAWLQA